MAAHHDTVYNPTGGPVTLDRAGRTLGPGEWAAAKTDAQPARGHVTAGRLLVVARPDGADDGDLNPAALAAFRATAALNGDTEGSTDTPEEL